MRFVFFAATAVRHCRFHVSPHAIGTFIAGRFERVLLALSTCMYMLQGKLNVFFLLGIMKQEDICMSVYTDDRDARLP